MFHKRRPVVQAWQYLSTRPAEILEKLAPFGPWEMTSESFTFHVTGGEAKALTVVHGEWIVFDGTDWTVVSRGDFSDTYEPAP